MSTSDQHTGARAATVLDSGANSARSGAAVKENIADAHHAQANRISGVGGMAETEAALRHLAYLARLDGAVRRGIAGAFSRAASEHRGNDHTSSNAGGENTGGESTGGDE